MQRGTFLGIIVMLLNTEFSAAAGNQVILPACTNLQDTRLQRSHLIRVRNFETETGPTSTTYILSGNIHLEAFKHCKNVEVNTIEFPPSQKSSIGIDPQIQDVHKRTEKYFTQHGQYFDGNFYYESSSISSYCVKSVSGSSLTVQVCKPSCNGTGEYCIPKCCAPDEVIGYWAGNCRKMKHSFAYSPKIADKEKYKSLRKSYQRNQLACEDGIKRLPFRDMVGSIKGGVRLFDEKENIKFEIIDGKLQLVHLSPERKWEVEKRPFCVDAFVTSPNTTYSDDNEDDQVAIVCPSMSTDVGEMSGTIMEAWVYAVVSIIASLFLIAIVIVYCILPEKRNFHGMVILSYSFSTLWSYLLYSAAHFITLFPNEEFTGVGKRGAFCMTIAIGSHYFLFTSFAWLTVMNVDLWRTFSSFLMISPKDKRLKDFTIYSLIAWGIPLLLIVSFTTVDEIYRDPLTLVVVPDYASTSCSVAHWSRGHYVYAPLAIILVSNGIITFLTFFVLFRARRNVSKLASKGPERYTATLFLKLFCIMGVAWFFQMLSWFYNGESKPWIFLVVDIIMHMQAIALFCLFCCNERTLQNLQNEYPSCSRIVNGIRKFEEIICCRSTTPQGKLQPETEPLNVTQSQQTESSEMGSN